MSKYTALYYFGFTVDCDESDASDVTPDQVAYAIQRRARQLLKDGRLPENIELEEVEDNTCDTCQGNGEVLVGDPTSIEECKECNGSGESTPEQDPDTRDR